MNYILATLATFTVIVVINAVYQKLTNGVCKSKKKLGGKVALVTGGTSGIGLEIAKDFARRGAKVIVACPFKEEGENAKTIIMKETGHEVVFKLLDLASLKSIRDFAADIMKTEDRLDILMNNAGVGLPGDFYTQDKINFVMQVNYFGHFLLTLLLLPLLKKSASKSEPSRIVNTSSGLHLLGSTNIEKLNRTGYWYKLQLYSNSKLCLVLFAHELSKRLKGSNVVVNGFEPGIVGTRIFNSLNVVTGTIITFLAKILFKTARDGAQTAIHIAVDDAAGKVSGQHFKDCELTRAKKSAYDDVIAKKLWEESTRLVKLSNDEIEKYINGFQ
ncbi:retinol dehydrogenase 11-like [Pectinophora gossypiella]|uniref:retinol dehydrogenase 11-like n=1 Tax=Pectinophora gossypiella TaxID=13191 RepID=UPI00214E3D91|nr:retinol dehydrogenase 11-like [Pectinophora gossypiella]